jgi:hypothetical protein
LQNSFLTFQRHRQSVFPKILEAESTTSPPAQGSPPLGFRSEVQDKENTKENPKETETSSKKEEAP